MHRSYRLWIGLAALAVAIAAMMTFLFHFTHTDRTDVFVSWSAAYKLEADGTYAPLEMGEYGELEALKSGDTVRFEAVLTGDVDAPVLTVQAESCTLALSLEGEALFSGTLAPRGDLISVALPADYSGKTLTVDYCYTAAEDFYPQPILRVSSTWIQDSQSYAYANHFGIRAGAYGCVTIVIFALFIFSFLMKKPDASLLVLALASLSLVVNSLTSGIGYIFIPEPILNVLRLPVFDFLPALCVALYLLLNRRRSFRQYFLRISLCALAVLAVFYLVSLWQGSYLSSYINEEITVLFTAGEYNGILNWITVYLLYASLGVAAFFVGQSAAQMYAERESLALRNKLVETGYRAIEQNTRAVGALRHEMKNHIAAMQILHENGDYDGVGKYLEKLRSADARIARTRYTGNFMVNAILQNYAARAEEAGIRFEAEVSVPEKLEIEDSDLSSLLMNILDNAVEACLKLPNAEARFIRLRINQKGSYFAVSCENAYDGQLVTDQDGDILTSKEEKAAHGYGLRQMEKIAKKYRSTLNISTADAVFRLQTALQLGQAG